MTVSKQDAELFFELMFPLQQYVNEKMRILPAVKSVADYNKCSYEEKLEVRNALYENIELIDEFVRDNPHAMAKERLAIIKEWKRFVQGKFYIERFLKKHAIFIGFDNRVYAVLGLHDSLDEMMDRSGLPFLVNAVLLPFKGKIVFDGLLLGYTSIFFGSHIKGELREAYMAAKENDHIIDHLNGNTKKTERSTRVSKDWQKELAQLEKYAGSLKESTKQAAVINRAFKMVKASISFAMKAAANPDEISDLKKELEKVGRAVEKADDTLYRASRYLD